MEIHGIYIGHVHGIKIQVHIVTDERDFRIHGRNGLDGILHQGTAGDDKVIILFTEVAHGRFPFGGIRHCSAQLYDIQLGPDIACNCFRRPACQVVGSPVPTDIGQDGNHLLYLF